MPNFNLDLMTPYADQIFNAVAGVINDRNYILGPNVKAFEEEFAGYTEQAHAIGVGNGTDAIRIALLALGIKPGDEVISPAFNVAYTALAVAAVGAVNVFVDCDPATMLMDVTRIEHAITSKTRAIIPVHLYGQMVDMSRVNIIAREHGLMVIEDAAQCHGATQRGLPPGKHSHAVAYSFYPTKNLGALGEAGAITTNIDAVAERARLLRDGGRTDRYLHVMQGINSCLDEIQAAILRVKLPWLDRRNAARRDAAQYYRDKLAGSPGVLLLNTDQMNTHVHHLFAIQAKRRDELHAYLADRMIPTLIHYPIPVPYQPCFMDKAFGGPWPMAEHGARSVLSLPMHPDITRDEQDIVINAIKEFYGNTA